MGGVETTGVVTLFKGKEVLKRAEIKKTEWSDSGYPSEAGVDLVEHKKLEGRKWEDTPISIELELTVKFPRQPGYKAKLDEVVTGMDQDVELRAGEVTVTC